MQLLKLSFDPPVIAHRGASSLAPENTLAAFRKAKEIGVKWVEFDVMLALDNQVVVIHDETVDRSTNGKGLVSDYPYSYLKSLDAGSWFDTKFLGERIPLFSEVLELLGELKLFPNIEIKAQPGKEELTVKIILDQIKNHWKTTETQFLISSFSVPILEIVRLHAPHYSLGFLMHEWDESWERICDRLQCSAVDVNQKILSSQNIQKIKKTDRKLLAYTVNDVQRAKELFAWGVDAVFTDYPQNFL